MITENSIWLMTLSHFIKRLHQRTMLVDIPKFYIYWQALLRGFTVKRTNSSVRMKRWEISHFRNHDHLHHFYLATMFSRSHISRWTQSSLSRSGTGSPRLASPGPNDATEGYDLEFFIYFLGIGIFCVYFFQIFVGDFIIMVSS